MRPTPIPCPVLVLVVWAVLTLAGCAATGGGAPPPALPSPAAPDAESVSRLAEPADDPADPFPRDLVATWNGDGVSITFDADGHFTRTGRAAATGQARVRGSRMTLESSGAPPVVTTWSLDGGVLRMGTSVYLRDDGRSASFSLVGFWIDANGPAHFRFREDGTYDFADPRYGTSSGTYRLVAATLTLVPRSRPTATYGVAYDGTFLSFTTVDGEPAGQYVRAG